MFRLVTRLEINGRYTIPYFFNCFESQNNERVILEYPNFSIQFNSCKKLPESLTIFMREEKNQSWCSVFCRECAEILESMKQLAEAAQLYESSQYYDKVNMIRTLELLPTFVPLGIKIKSSWTTWHCYCTELYSIFLYSTVLYCTVLCNVY